MKISRNILDESGLRRRSLAAYSVWGVLALGLVACGGTEDSARIEADIPAEDAVDPLSFAPSECEDAVELFEFSVLEDFESTLNLADGTRSRMGQAELLGWWVSDDGTNLNRLPRPSEQFAQESEVSQRRAQILSSIGGAARLVSGSCADSDRAMRVESASPGFSQWGYTLGSNPKVYPEDAGGEQVSDAGAWDGVAFWIKGQKQLAVPNVDGDDSLSFEDVTAFVALPDPNTDEGDFCRDGIQDEFNCDAFGRGVSVTKDWRLKVIPFADMVQRGFGRPRDELDTSAIQRLKFDLPLGMWEIWVDQVSYFRFK